MVESMAQREVSVLAETVQIAILKVENYLQELLGGLTLDEVRAAVLRELGSEKSRYDDMVSAALRLSSAALAKDREADVIVSGRANLLGAASDEDGLHKTKELLRALEEKEILVKLLDQAAKSERIQVFLGAETAHSALGEAAVVATSYGPDDHPVGAIAVVGPTRMNYGKVMSVVDFTAELITELLDDGAG